MTRAKSIATLAAALGPLDGLPGDVVAVYVAALGDIPEDDLADAVRHLIETQEERWWPTVATIRRLVFERRLGLPDPETAWALVQGAEYRRQAPAPVAAALAAVGGSWALRTSPQPEKLRSAFISQYKAARRNALVRESGASRALASAPVLREIDGGDVA